MSFYVKRWDPDHDGSWTGPIRSERQAHREAAAWQDAGWTAVVLPSSPEVKAAVRQWQQAKQAARA